MESGVGRLMSAELHWWYGRGQDTVVITRRLDGSGYHLIVRSLAEPPVRRRFLDGVTLAAGHHLIESRLTAEGWSLEQVQPPRRLAS